MHSWPTSFDAAVTVTFLVLVLLVVTLGYVFMALDICSYLRSLRRALVHVGRLLPEIPHWARHETPRSVAALGLSLPCSEDELKRAYRRRVKSLHPDRGGDQRRFLHLQQQFEQALEFVMVSRGR